MTRDEAQEILNGMYMPFGATLRNIEGNEKLESTGEYKKLLQSVICLEILKDRYLSINKKYVKIQKKAQKKLLWGADIVLAYMVKIIKQYRYIPFLIYQILFYIIVTCDECGVKVTQKRIIKELNDAYSNEPHKKSHNFFSRKQITPAQYIAMRKYKQPELPVKYMGQKNEELAVAIKHLAYQAGEYDVFCDIFGGSGAATLAVPRRQGAEYVYNELHRTVNNLFAVLADDILSKDLIYKLELLQRALFEGSQWLGIGFYNNNILPVIQSQSVTSKGQAILANKSKTFCIPASEIIRCMEDFNSVLSVWDDFPEFYYGGNSYDRAKLLNDVFIDAVANPSRRLECINSFNKNFNLIKAINREHFENNGIGFSLFKGNLFDSSNSSKSISILEWICMCEQIRAYEYYLYFEALRKDGKHIAQHDKVLYAVAESYYQSIEYLGNRNDEPILRMYDNVKGVDESYYITVKKFEENPFAKSISEVCKKLQGTIQERLNCIDFIIKYEHNSQLVNIKHDAPLFYSDSPYMATDDYKDEANGINEFTHQDMKNLILALKNSGDKFIFSCRAVKDMNARASFSKKNKKDTKNKTLDIFEFVFEHFLAEFYEKGIDLWVLAIEKNGETLSDLVKGDKKAEIMITNYEIYRFKEKNTVYKVYTFEEFLQILVDDAKV